MQIYSLNIQLFSICVTLIQVISVIIEWPNIFTYNIIHKIYLHNVYNINGTNFYSQSCRNLKKLRSGEIYMSKRYVGSTSICDLPWTTSSDRFQMWMSQRCIITSGHDGSTIDSEFRTASIQSRKLEKNRRRLAETIASFHHRRCSTGWDSLEELAISGNSKQDERHILTRFPICEIYKFRLATKYFENPTLLLMDSLSNFKYILLKYIYLYNFFK